jgi:hypothetical protein
VDVHGADLTRSEGGDDLGRKEPTEGRDISRVTGVQCRDGDRCGARRKKGGREESGEGHVDSAEPLDMLRQAESGRRRRHEDDRGAERRFCTPATWSPHAPHALARVCLSGLVQ